MVVRVLVDFVIYCHAAICITAAFSCCCSCDEVSYTASSQGLHINEPSPTHSHFPHNSAWPASKQEVKADLENGRA